MNDWYIDTSFLTAFTFPRDKYHSAALALYEEFPHRNLFTSDEVLSEYLNHFSAQGSHLRSLSVQTVDGILELNGVTVFAQSRETFTQGLALYRSRKDKEYSHTDCVSMLHMKANGITEILTADHHFTQAGFKILMKA